MKKISKEEILKIVNSILDIEITADQFDVDLLGLGLDSIKFIQVVVSLEEAFECEIPDSKLLISEMDTIKKMFDVLQELYNYQM